MTGGYEGRERRKEPPITKGQLNEVVQQARIRTVMGGLLLFLTFVLAALSTVNTFVAADRARQTQFDIRQSQYDVCQMSGNALRAQVRAEFRDLKHSALIPVFAGVARTLPEEESVREILEDTVRLLHKRGRTLADRIPDADCLKLYPPLDGQTFEN